MADWIWVLPSAALAAHGRQLAEHGGGDGVRDPGLFESAMARPQNLLAYGDRDAAALAANYAFCIARNHPFIDGNTRTAMVISETFQILNGLRLEVSEPEIVVTFLALAAGELSEEQLAQWFRERIKPA